MMTTRLNCCLILLLLVGGVYGLTGNYKTDINVDAQASALAAWSLAERNSLVVDQFRNQQWITSSRLGPVSDRPPGTFVFAVPFYWLSSSSNFTVTPSTICAVTLATLTVLFLFLLFCRVADPHVAFCAALLFAFSTATWTISANQLWPHATTQCALAVALLAMTSEYFVLAGIAFGFAFLARPPTLVIPIVMAGVLVIMLRRVSPSIKLILGIVPAVVALLFYNYEVFGALGFSGGYSAKWGEQLVDTTFSANVLKFIDAFIGSNGLLVWSPFIVVLLFGLREGWRRASALERGAAIAGLVYLLIHVRMGRVSGGLAFNYRYQLESLTLAAPLLFLSYQHFVSKRALLRGCLAAAIVVSIGLQTIYRFNLRCEPLSETEVSCRLF